MNPALWLQRSAALHPEAPALLRGTALVADYAGFARRAAWIGAGLAAGFGAEFADGDGSGRDAGAGRGAETRSETGAARGTRGVAPGDRVAIFAANSTAYLEALFGIWWAGAAAVPINAKLHPREAAWIIANAGAGLVFADAGRDVGLIEAGVDAIVLPFGADGVAGLGEPPPALAAAPTEQAEPPAPVPMAGNALAWLFYTSGTTGTPKGVQITCDNLAAMVSCYFVDVDTVHPTDAMLYAAPMSHGAGLYTFMPVLRAARHVVPESGGFDAGEVLGLAAALGQGRDVVTMFAAPTMVRRLVEAAKAQGSTGAGLRTVVYAGGPMYEADILAAVETMGPRFVQIYGQGECPMGITALSRADVADRSHPRWRERLGSVGTAQARVEVAVVGTDGRPLRAGMPGEIVVRGATVMAGYWQNPGATAAALCDGWLYTGDVGRLDADGYLTLQDRSKDVIISGGSNIYPREVEEVLLSHPEVAEVSVVGQPDPEWGEVVVAFVVGTAPPAALDALCLERIARFKRPKTYRFLAALPKNNYGKVLKTDLRARLSGGG